MLLYGQQLVSNFISAVWCQAGGVRSDFQSKLCSRLKLSFPLSEEVTDMTDVQWDTESPPTLLFGVFFDKNWHLE